MHPLEQLGTALPRQLLDLVILRGRESAVMGTIACLYRNSNSSSNSSRNNNHTVDLLNL